MADLSTSPTKKMITINKVTNVTTEIVKVEFDKNITKYIKTQLGQYDLKILDQIRDVILQKKGNETLIIAGTSFGANNNGSTELSTFIDDLISAQT